MKTKAGFTLLEILVVVLIITILSTIVGVRVAREPGRARQAAALAQVRAFKVGLQMYRVDHSMLPTQRQGLDALCRRPTSSPVPGGSYPEEGYLESRNVPQDPWGNDYVYLVPGRDGSSVEVLSYGADGEPGGEGEAADVSSADL